MAAGTRLLILVVVGLGLVAKAHWTDELDLPPILLEYRIRNDPVLKVRCLADPECPIDPTTLSNGRCWGHEAGCPFEASYSANVAKCNLPTERWTAKDRPWLLKQFYGQGDFGYLNSEGRGVLHDICSSDDKDKTRLSCSDHLAYCTAENIFFDYKHLDARHSKRYRDDVIHEGEVGGNCENFRPEILNVHSDRLSYLQSWGHELKQFASSEDFRVDDDHCDVIFERPTIIIKLDASINMFHHFCDFINLYASQHLNGSEFGTDVDILWWDTWMGGFVDTYFGTTWAAFSKNKPVELTSLDGKRVCFKKAMLPLLARQRFGMYYNMPLIDGCQGSGLMHAFSHHLLHRLRVEQRGPLLDTVRITILSRSTAHRQIVNVNELLARLHTIAGVDVRIVDYNGKVPFLDQLDSTHNSDIFIGMHGSGLTHLLFLPDWAAIFEIYNCDDDRCYLDLARLRGVKYRTWGADNKGVTAHGEGKHPTNGTPHAKFTNYSFDVDEFERIVKQLIEYVRRHPMFVDAQRKLRREKRQREAVEQGRTEL